MLIFMDIGSLVKMKKSLNQIQWLRGLAALLVVFTHLLGKAYSTGMSSVSFAKGGVGVDLFFVISGFIMVYVCDGKTQTTKKFLANRALRILPLHYVILIPIFCLYLLKPELVNSTSKGTLIIESFLLIPNKSEGYEYLNPVIWTLCYEVMFYLIFSVFLGFKDILKTSISTIIAILLLTIFGLIYTGENTIIKAVTNSISLEFCYGILSYYIFKKKLIKINPYILISFGFTLLISMLDMNITRAFSVGIPALLVFHGFLYLENKKIKPLNLLGTISYEIYISHIATITITYILLKKFNLTKLWIYLPVSLSLIIITGFILNYFVTRRISSLENRKKIRISN